MLQNKLKNLFQVIEQLEQVDFKVDKLLTLLEGSVEKQVVNKIYNKFIVKNTELDINTIIIDCYQGIINAIFFNGDIGIKVKDISIAYPFQESYSHYDDLYFYSSQLSYNNNNYRISFFVPDHNELSYSENNNLPNLTITRQE